MVQCTQSAHIVLHLQYQIPPHHFEYSIFPVEFLMFWLLSRHLKICLITIVWNPFNAYFDEGDV